MVGATVSTKGNTLTIGVAHPFHFEIANKAQNIALLTAIVEKVVNQKPRISILLDEGVEKEPSKHVDASFVQQIASDFGGQVVG